MNKISAICLASLLLMGSANAVEDVDGSLANLPPNEKARLLDLMDRYLRDGPSSRFRSIRKIDQGRVCGLVNPRNQLGAYVGYREFLFDAPKDFFIIGGEGADKTSQALVATACGSLGADDIKRLLKSP